MFNPLSYQFPHVLGLAFGTGEVSIERLSPVARKWLLVSCAFLVAASFALRQEFAFDGQLNSPLSRSENRLAPSSSALCESSASPPLE